MARGGVVFVAAGEYAVASRHHCKYGSNAWDEAGHSHRTVPGRQFTMALTPSIAGQRRILVVRGRSAVLRFFVIGACRLHRG